MKLHFLAHAQRIKKPFSRIFLILQETETPKIVLILSQKKTILIFRETELFCFSGKEYLEL